VVSVKSSASLEVQNREQQVLLDLIANTERFGLSEIFDSVIVDIAMEAAQALESLETEKNMAVSETALEWSLKHARISQQKFFGLLKILSRANIELTVHDRVQNLKIKIFDFSDEELNLISASCKQAITGALRALEAVDRVREAETVNKSLSCLKPLHYELKTRSDVEYFSHLWNKYGLNSCFFVDFLARFALEISILDTLNQHFSNLSKSEVFFLAENLANWEAILCLIDPSSSSSWEICDELVTTIFELTFSESSPDELEQIKDYYFLKSAKAVIISNT